MVQPASAVACSSSTTPRKRCKAERENILRLITTTRHGAAIRGQAAIWIANERSRAYTVSGAWSVGGAGR
jgi:hypothetical protein